MTDESVAFDSLKKELPYYEQIVITNLKGNHPLGKTLVFQIPPTMAEHNVIMALLQRVRLEWPGAWYCAQEWERNQMPKTIGPPKEPKEPKAVSREHLGLPSDDTLGDVPL